MCCAVDSRRTPPSSVRVSSRSNAMTHMRTLVRLYRAVPKLKALQVRAHVCETRPD